MVELPGEPELTAQPLQIGGVTMVVGEHLEGHRRLVGRSVREIHGGAAAAAQRPFDDIAVEP